MERRGLIQRDQAFVSLNSFAYEIDSMAPSGFNFDTICGIERSEIRTYENFVWSYQFDLEKLKNLEPGTEEYSKARMSLNSSKELLDTQIRSMTEFNIGSTLIVTVRVILYKDYNLDSSLFFEQVDDLKMTKMVISPSVFNEETKTFNVSPGTVLVELSSSALCPGYSEGQSLDQAVRSYLDTVFGNP